MKHIKFFESFNDNQHKDYFNDKIDWELFSYIKDLLTGYEDQGIHTYVHICTMKDANKEGFIIYRSEVHDFEDEDEYYYDDEQYYDDNDSDDDTTDYTQKNNDFSTNLFFNKNKYNYERNKTILYKVSITENKSSINKIIRESIQNWYQRKTNKQLDITINTGIIYIYITQE